MWSKTNCYGVLLALAVQQSPKPADTFVEIDFAKIDRTLLKEPKYVAEPRYALFVLDPAGRFACWAAFDKAAPDAAHYDVLYFDTHDHHAPGAHRQARGEVGLTENNITGPASQAECRGFDPLRPLHLGLVVRQGYDGGHSAKLPGSALANRSCSEDWTRTTPMERIPAMSKLDDARPDESFRASSARSRGLRRRSHSCAKTRASLALLTVLVPGCRGWTGETTLRAASNHLVLAPVEVSGTEGWFLVDTGTSGSIVSPGLASKLDSAAKIHQISGFGGANRPIDAPQVKSGNIRFAGSRLKYPEEVSVLDLGFLTPWAGMPVDGILGWDVLREYAWGIDVGAARLVAGRELSSKKILDFFGVDRADSTSVVTITDDLPFVTVLAQGQSLQLMLDTGAERTTLSPDAWKRLGLEVPTTGKPAVIRGVDGDTSGHIARLAALQVGSMVWTGPEVMVLDASSPGDRDGLLGMDLLSDCLIILEGRSRTLLLAKRPANPH